MLLQILQDFRLMFGTETADKLLEKWHTFYKAKVIREAERELTPSPVIRSLLKSARNLQDDDSEDRPGIQLKPK